MFDEWLHRLKMEQAARSPEDESEPMESEEVLDLMVQSKPTDHRAAVAGFVAGMGGEQVDG